MDRVTPKSAHDTVVELDSAGPAERLMGLAVPEYPDVKLKYG